MTLQEHLASLGACEDAREWAADKPAKEVWGTCPRADWMLWWAARTPANSKQDIVRVAAAIAKTVLLRMVVVGFPAGFEEMQRWKVVPEKRRK